MTGVKRETMHLLPSSHFQTSVLPGWASDVDGGREYVTMRTAR